MKSLQYRWYLIVALVVATGLLPVNVVEAQARKKPMAQAAVTVTDLRTERLVNPMSIDTPTPRLGWRIEATVNDVMQTAYQNVAFSYLI